MDKPTIGSLFAGGGGIDLGFERAGFQTVWQVEQDEYCRKVLAKNFPHADRSVTGVRSGNSSTLSRVDVITGGFPCQDISIAGRGVGITGARSGLWKEMHRIIGELRPRYVLVENVPMLLKRGIDVVLGDLAEIGYDAEWEIISVADVGAPHLRERVWIVASPAEVLGNASSNLQCGGFSSVSQLRNSNSENISPYSREERTKRIFTEKIPRFSTFSWCKNVRRVEDLRDRPDLPPPIFRGTRDGIPNWSHRVGLLGNAVVPQIPEWIAGQILKDMNRPENGQGEE